MTFQLVLQRAVEPEAGVKAVGEDVFLADLPTDYGCYAFFYPGAMPSPDESLEESLRRLGETAGRNLFVNVGSLADPDYGTMAELFQIERNPVIVMTALAPLASTPRGELTAYVRLDSPELLASPEKTLELVHELFNLYQRGRFAEAMSKAKWQRRSELAAQLGRLVTEALGGAWRFVSERDFVVSLLEGRFELKRSGD